MIWNIYGQRIPVQDFTSGKMRRWKCWYSQNAYKKWLEKQRLKCRTARSIWWSDVNRLTQAKDMDELYEAMCLILEKFTFLFKYWLRDWSVYWIPWSDVRLSSYKALWISCNSGRWDSCVLVNKDGRAAGSKSFM